MYTAEHGLEAAKTFTLLQNDKVSVQVGASKSDYLAGVGYKITNKFELSAGLAMDKKEWFDDVETYVGAAYTWKF